MDMNDLRGMRPTRIEEPQPQHGEFVNMPALRALTADDVIRIRDFYDANGVFIGNRKQVIDTTKSSSRGKEKQLIGR